MPKKLTTQMKRRRMSLVEKEGITAATAEKLGFSSVGSLRTWVYNTRKSTNGHSASADGKYGSTERRHTNAATRDRHKMPLSTMAILNHKVESLLLEQRETNAALKEIRRELASVRGDLNRIVAALFEADDGARGKVAMMDI